MALVFATAALCSQPALGKALHEPVLKPVEAEAEKGGCRLDDAPSTPLMGWALLLWFLSRRREEAPSRVPLRVLPDQASPE